MFSWKTDTSDVTLSKTTGILKSRNRKITQTKFKNQSQTWVDDKIFSKERVEWNQVFFKGFLFNILKNPIIHSEQT